MLLFTIMHALSLWILTVFNIDINKTLEFLKKNTIFKNGITIKRKQRKISAIIVVNFGVTE